MPDRFDSTNRWQAEKPPRQYSMLQLLLAMGSFSVALASFSLMISNWSDLRSDLSGVLMSLWPISLFVGLGIGILGGEKGVIYATYSSVTVGFLMFIAVLGGFWMLIPALLLAAMILYGILTM